MKKLIGMLLATLAMFSVTFVSCKAETDTPSTPTITTNIANANNAVVEDGTELTVVATGDAPLTYQWYKDGAIISGATESSYIVDGDGSYYVKVSNVAGSVNSYTVIVSGVILPVITTQPTDMVIANLNSNTDYLVAKATADNNANIVAVWYCDGVSASGQTTGKGSVETKIKPLQFGRYECKFYTLVDGVKSPEVTTDVVTVEEKAISLRLSGIPVIGYVGDELTVEVYCDVPCDYTYVWTMKGNDSGKIVTLGETSNSYLLTESIWEEMSSDGSVNIAVKVIAESKATGNKVSKESSYCTFTITDLDVPVFSLQPTGPASIYCNESVKLSAEASVTDGAITYQWYKNNSIIEGATSASYTVSFACTVDDGKTNEYYVIATNTLGDDSASKASTSVYITVNHEDAENGAGNGGFDFN